MRTPRKLLPALAGLVLVPLTLAACGGDSVPGNAIASIGGDSVKVSAFDHWMQIAATGNAQQAQTGGATAKGVVPDAPNFTKCIASKRKTTPKPAKGQPNVTDASLKTQCKTEYTSLRSSVMSFLVTSAWIQGEAHDRNVKFTDAQAKKEFDTQRVQSFPKTADYTAFLKTSGYTQEDLLYRIRIQELSNKLRDAVVKGKDKVSEAQIAAYYNKNKSRFATPESRALRIVLTKTQAKANEAKKALEGGQSWKTVAAKYSIDQTSKASGGVLPAVTKGQQEKALDDAVFKASKGSLEGPVKTQFGYYIFDVTKITPANQQSLTEAKATVKQLLVSQGQQTALNSFLKSFRSKWKPRTDCQGDYKTSDCNGQPEPKTDTVAATTPSQ
jgi:foldase protein PrsA